LSAAQLFASLSEDSATGLDKKQTADRANAEMERALEFVKPEDPQYGVITVTVANQRLGRGDVQSAEKLLRDGLAKQPADLEIRRRLAELLGGGPARGDEAIALLSEHVNLTPQQRTGRAGLRQRNLEDQVSIDLSQLRLAKYDAMAVDGLTAQEQDQAKQLIAQSEQALAGLLSRAPNHPAVLRLQGHIQKSQGKLVEATQTYSKALQSAGDNPDLRYPIALDLAQLLLRGNQLGQAESLLKDIYKDTHHDGTRRLLIETLIRENKMDEARALVDEFRKEHPDSPDGTRLAMAVLDPKTQKAELTKLYQQLPEQTRPQRMEKIRVALGNADQTDDAIRLLQAMLKEDPADADAARTLANVYASQKDGKDKALAVLDAALKAKPGFAPLEWDRQRIAGANPEDMQRMQLEAIQQLPPFDREMGLSQYEFAHNNLPAAVAHAREAEKLQPKNPRPLQFLYTAALSQRDWPTAEAYVNKMADPEVNGDRFGGLLLRWELARAQGDLNKALEYATTLTRDKSEFGESFFALGVTLQQMGKHDDAIFNLTQARDKQPNNPQVYDALIRSAYALNRPSEAKKYIDEARKNLRRVPAVDEWATDYEVRFGDPEKVLAQRQDLLKQHPDDPDAYQSLASTYVAIGDRRTEAKKDAEAKDNYAKARDTLQQALAKWPENLVLTQNFGRVSIALKDVDAGERQWKALLARPEWADKPQALLRLADYYQSAGPEKLPAAEQTLRDALAKSGGANPDIQLRLASVLFSLKKPDDAVAVLSAGGTDDPRLTARKVDILISADKNDQAEQTLKTAIAGYQQRNQPVPSDLLNQLSLVYSRTKRVPQAIEVLNQLVAQDPKNTMALLRRAALAGTQSQASLDEAIKDLSTVRDANPRMIEARYLLADYLGRKRDTEGRMRELEGVLSVDPAQRQARMMLLEAYSNANPPRWGEVERLLADARNLPNMGNDVQLLDIEAKMWAKRGDANRALEKFSAAIKADPGNFELLRTYFGLMLQAKRYREVLDVSTNQKKEFLDKLNQFWWIHRVRGEALAALKQKDAALQEFDVALEQSFAGKDAGASDVVLSSMGQSLGPDAVLAALAPKVKTGEPRWLMTAANMQMAKQNVPAARELMDQVLAKVDTLPPATQAQVLSFTANLYMVDPNPDSAKAKGLYERVVKMQPDNYLAWNNLASNKLLKPEESLEYSTKAFDALQRAGVTDSETVPYIKDTHGYNLVLAGRVDEGLAILMEAYQSKQFPDVAYHLGQAFLKQNKPEDAEKYLIEANRLFGEYVEKRLVTDLKLQDDISSALQQARELKAKQASGAGQ
jgi:predicted Zn-dependent protease